MLAPLAVMDFDGLRGGRGGFARVLSLVSLGATALYKVSVVLDHAGSLGLQVAQTSLEAYEALLVQTVHGATRLAWEAEKTAKAAAQFLAH
eukprot:13269716-Alexandrium_andersonii.AAC.1